MQIAIAVPITLAACVASVGCDLDALAVHDCSSEQMQAADGCQTTWSAPQHLLTGEVAGLAIAVDGAGNVVAAAEVVEPGGSDAVAITVVGQDVVAVELDSALPGNSFEPRVVASPVDASAFVVWRQGAADMGTGVFAARRTPGENWTLPTGWASRLSEGDNAYEPDAAIGPHGEAVVVWNQWTGANYQVDVADVNAADGTVVPGSGYLSAPVNFANNPRVRIGVNGLALVSWYQAPPSSDLMAFASGRPAEADDFLSVGAEDHLSAQFGPVEGTWPAVSSDGRQALVWRQEYAPGAFGVFLSTRSANGQWSTPTVPVEALSAGHGPILSLQAAFCSPRRLVVVWQALAPASGTGVWVASGDVDGGSWKIRRLSPVLAVAVRPHLAVDEIARIAAVAWVDETTHPHNVMTVFGHTTEDGVIWGAAETLARLTTNDAVLAALAFTSAPSPSAVVAWVEPGAAFLARRPLPRL